MKRDDPIEATTPAGIAAALEHLDRCDLTEEQRRWLEDFRAKAAIGIVRTTDT